MLEVPSVANPILFMIIDSVKLYVDLTNGTPQLYLSELLLVNKSICVCACAAADMRERANVLAAMLTKRFESKDM